MQEFKLDKNKFRLNYAELLIFQGKIAIGIALIAFLLFITVNENHWLFGVLPYIYALVFILFLFYEIWDQRWYYRSYRLKIINSLIIWTQGRCLSIKIKKVNIIRIQKLKPIKKQKENLFIVSEKAIILVPEEIEQYDEVVELLAQIHPITTRRYSGIRELQNN